MSIDSITARMAQIDTMLAAVNGSPSTSTTSFASALQSAQTAQSGPTAGAPSTTLAPGGDSTYDAQIQAAASKYGVDAALLKGLIKQESGFNPSARSGAGAVGLTQLMPGTAASLGVTDPTDPAQAIDGGAKYLAQQLQRFGGDQAKALAAYNAGPGAVAKYGGVPPYAETQNYVQTVLANAAQYRAAAPTAVPAATTPVPAASTPTGALAYSTT